MMLFCCFADGQITSLDAFNLNFQFVLDIYHFRMELDSDQTPPGVKALREMVLASAKKIYHFLIYPHSVRCYQPAPCLPSIKLEGWRHRIACKQWLVLGDVTDLGSLISNYTHQHICCKSTHLVTYSSSSVLSPGWGPNETHLFWSRKHLSHPSHHV